MLHTQDVFCLYQVILFDGTSVPALCCVKPLLSCTVLQERMKCWVQCGVISNTFPLLGNNLQAVTKMLTSTLFHTHTLKWLQQLRPKRGFCSSERRKKNERRSWHRAALLSREQQAQCLHRAARFSKPMSLQCLLHKLVTNLEIPTCLQGDWRRTYQHRFLQYGQSDAYLQGCSSPGIT